MKKALIVGCGYVGTKLAKNLFKLGISVTGIRRDSSALPDEVTGLSHDVSSTSTLPIPQGTDVVFYTVAASEQSESGYREAYISGLKNTIQAAEDANVKRLIFVSSTAVYHQDDGSWVDETSPTHPTEYNGKIMLEAESLVLSAKIKTVTVRFSGIYGPGRNYFINGVQSGKLGLIGKKHYSNRIHRDDCAGILQHLATIDSPQALYIGSDELPTLWDDFISYIANHIGTAPAKTHSGPRSTSRRCSNERVSRSGYKFKYPTYREGYEKIIEDYLKK